MRLPIAILLAIPALAGTMQGIARITPSGLPVAGATIRATSGLNACKAISDSAGQFSLPELAPGRYQVTGEKEGLFASKRKRVAAVEISTERDLKEVIVEFVLPASVSGRITDEEWKPLRNVGVAIQGTNHGGSIVNTTSDEGAAIRNWIRRMSGRRPPQRMDCRGRGRPPTIPALRIRNRRNGWY